MYASCGHTRNGGGGLLAVSRAKSKQQAEEILKTYKLFAI